MKSKIVYTYQGLRKGVPGRVAEINIDVQLEYGKAPNEVPWRITVPEQSSTGQILFDLDKGVVLQAELKQALTVVQAREGALQNNDKIKSDIELTVK